MDPARAIRALFILTYEEQLCRRYVEALSADFPQLDVRVADHHTKAGQYIESVDVLLTFSTMISDEVVRAARRLKWIQVLGTGTDGVVDLPSLDRDVIVTRIRGIHGPAMSEAALALMLALSRDFPRAMSNQRRHAWERWPSTLLCGKTVGILGIGSIAEALAPRCKAMGMTVVGFSSTPRKLADFDHIWPREALLREVGELDYLVVLIPLSAATRRLVDARVINVMKPTAYLINLARGGIVDEQALADALDRGAIGGAALDVFDREPLPESSPLWNTPNLIVTPHLGGAYDRYVDDAMPIVNENMRCFLAGDFASMKNRIQR